MGADIDGAIESRSTDGRWKVEVALWTLGLGRDTNAFECLFGAGRGEVGADRPLFAARGIPDDVSAPVREGSLFGDCEHSHTYATWAEVAAVDWDAPVADGPAWLWAGEWRSGEDGELVLHDVVWVTPAMNEAADDAFGGDFDSPAEWPPGGEVLLDGAIYRPVVLTARMIASPDKENWAALWTAMRDLAAEHGDENVRLVAWFG